MVPAAQDDDDQHTLTLSNMAYKSAYTIEASDIEDDYDRSGYMSPSLPTDNSPTSSDGITSPDHTPTFAHGGNYTSPTGLITQWTAAQCAEYITSLGFSQHAEAMIEEDIDGEALVAMQHQDLKEMGVNSVGHRLTILKGVYDTKIRQHVPLDQDHYVPPSAEGANDMSATQDDITRIIDSIALRDQRIINAEMDLRSLKEDLHRLVEENRKLREETLPMIRFAKDRSHPLPVPEQPLSAPLTEFKGDKANSGLSRKFSTKRLFLGSTPKNTSPTIPSSSHFQDTMSLDPSAAAQIAARDLLNTGSQHSPSQISQLSPTSPGYNMNTSGSGSAARTFATSGPQSGPDLHSYAGTSYHQNNSTATTLRGGRDNDTSHLSSTASTLLGVPPMISTSAPSQTSTSRDRDRDRDRDRGDRDRDRDRDRERERERERDKDNNIEIFKSFRISLDDPCHKVLPIALKRYQINDDWRQYALYIVHGDQERCLGLEEKPLMLFKQLDNQGRKPIFMLRKHASPAGEGWSGPGGAAAASGGSGGSGGGGGNTSNMSRAESMRGLPGGVL